MGLLLPIVLGGLALTGLPWIIHRIRRPSNNPTPFSSLMFLPDSVPPVRQRRRIEHPWLMLLRMAMLILLAMAYSRPYLLKTASANPESTEREHVLLVDTSLSASAPGQFESTVAAARVRLAELANDPVGVVAFNESAQVLASVETGVAEGALAQLLPTCGATNFLAGLRAAEQLLQSTDNTTPTEGEAKKERIIHLVSDLQRSGMPDEVTRHSLARGVTLRLVPIAPIARGNASVEAMALEAKKPSTLIARARVRNHGAERVMGTVEYWINGARSTSQAVSLQADSGVNIALSSDFDLTQPAEVEVRLVADDGLAADNSHFAVYVPEPVRDIGLVIDPAADRSQPVPFLEAALAESQPVPWRWVPVEPASLGSVTAPVLVLPGLVELSEENATRAEAYVEGGGRLLVVPSTKGFPPALISTLLAPVGLTVSGPKFERPDPAHHALLSWIDFASPAFEAFRSADYSDFSMLRFNNYFPLGLAQNAPVEVAARLQAGGEPASDPAMVAFNRGTGRAILWSFPLDPSWTNITRTRRFVPLLHETVALLLPPLPALRTHAASVALSPPPALSVDGLRLRVPGAEAIQPFVETAAAQGFSPGFVRWYSGPADEPALTEAVNVQPTESNLGTLSPEEFLLRLGVSAEEAVANSGPEIPNDVVHWEYGYPMLIALAIFGALESLLAVFLSRPKPLEQQVP